MQHLAVSEEVDFPSVGWSPTRVSTEMGTRPPLPAGDANKEGVVSCAARTAQS